MPFAATWMDLETHTKQTVTSYITYMWNLKKKKKRIQMNLFAEQKQTHRLGKIYGYPRGQVRGWNGWTGGLGLAYAH